MSNRLKIEDKLDTLNALLTHQNAAIDILASDKRSELVSNIEEIAQLIYSGEILEVMDYGDQIAPTWNDTTNSKEYTPAMNFCHTEDGVLENGDVIPVADFEWENTIPFGIPFDQPEAIFESESELAAGTYYFTVANDSWGGNNGKNIQFTLSSALPAGYQIRKSCAYNALVTSGTLDIYKSASATTKEYSVTPTEGTSGTFLGTSDGTGNINHWQRVALGYARYSCSFIRQWLNATGAKGTYYTKQNKWDVCPSAANAYEGFLHGYSEDVYKYFKKCKVVTYASNLDNNVKDETYDRVFLSSLTNMYASGWYTEGEQWEYYKRLLGVTSPISLWKTYTRLIKYAINNNTSAQECWRRSSYVSGLYHAMVVGSNGYLNISSAGNAFRCAPCVRIGK